MTDAPVRWALALVGSLLAHAALIAGLMVALRPDPVPDQPTPETRLDIAAYTLERSEARAAIPDAPAAAEDTAAGTSLASGAIPQSRASAEEPVSTPAPAATPTAQRLSPDSTPAPTLATMRPDTAALTPAQAPQARLATATPTGAMVPATAPASAARLSAAPDPAGRKIAVATPESQAMAAATPRPPTAKSLPPSADRLVSRADPSVPVATLAPQAAALAPARKPTAPLRANSPAPLPLAPAKVVLAALTRTDAPTIAAAAITPSTAPVAAVRVVPVSLPQRDAPLPSASPVAPSTPALPTIAPDTTAVLSATPDTTAVLSATPDTTVAPVATPDTTAAPIATPDTTAAPIATPDTTAVLSATTDITAAPIATPDTAIATETAPDTTATPEVRPEAERMVAALAFSGEGAGNADPLSLAAFQSFMRPGDPAANGDALRDGVAGLLAQVPCSRLQVAFDPETATLSVNGHIPEGDLRAPVLAALQAQMGTDITVSDNMLILPRPQCGALSGIAAVGLAQSTDQITNPLLIGENTQARVLDFVKNDRLHFDLVAPDYDAYIYVDYFDAGGNVLHLIPNDSVPISLSPAAGTLRVGTESDADAGLRIFIGPPYGQEISVAFAASAPLYDGTRPLIEPAAPYLDWLKERVAQARANDPGFKGEWVYFFVTTAEK